MSTDSNKKSKRGRGRPKMAKGQRQDVIKSVRFRPCDLKIFEREAKKSKKEFSEWLREILRQAIGK